MLLAALLACTRSVPPAAQAPAPQPPPEPAEACPAEPTVDAARLTATAADRWLRERGLAEPVLGYRVWFQPNGGNTPPKATVAAMGESEDGQLAVLDWVWVDEACQVERGEGTCEVCRSAAREHLVEALPAMPR